MAFSDNNGHASPWGESFHNSFLNDWQKGMGPGYILQSQNVLKVRVLYGSLLHTSSDPYKKAEDLITVGECSPVCSVTLPQYKYTYTWKSPGFAWFPRVPLN